MEEIKDIYPKGTSLKFGKDVIEVKSLPVETAGEIGDLLLVVAEKQKEIAKGQKQKGKEIDSTLIVKILVEAMKDSREAVLTLVQASTGVKREELNKITFEAFLVLLKYVVKENLDFFANNVAPQLNSLMESLSLEKVTEQVTTPADGQKQSKS